MQDLFGSDSPLPLAKEKGKTIAQTNHAQLLALYGKQENTTCKNCIFLRRVQFAGTYLKCDLAKQSRCGSTDWRAGWQACGKYTEKPKDAANLT